MFRPRLKLSLLLLTTLPASYVFAEPQWSHCAVPAYVHDSASEGSAVNPPRNQELRILADHILADEEQRIEAQGRAIMLDSKLRVDAERLIYLQQLGEIEAQGAVRLSTPQLDMDAEHIRYYPKRQSGQVDAPQYRIKQRHLRGSAESMELIDGHRSILNQAEFTSCDEGQSDWLLRAQQLSLDTQNNEGIAHHARVVFYGLPIFYFPYLSFPISGRKSGLLVPKIGESETLGYIFHIPYYWNIATNQDATLALRSMSRRGTQWFGEYRYLGAHSDAQIDAEFLQRDEQTKQQRDYTRLRHRAQYSPAWFSEVDYQSVSDTDYFEDFSSDLQHSSIKQLERRADLRYQAGSWNLHTRFQSFQNLDAGLKPEQHPYRRSPQIQFNHNLQADNGLAWKLFAEAVEFQRAAGVQGQRYDLYPRIEWPFRRRAGYVNPRVGWRHTQYRLEQQHSDYDEQGQRALPIASLDSGLFFERDLHIGGQSWLQTLEPRLYYLYVPFRQQDDLIVDQQGRSQVFDSGEPAFSYAQLFRDNRFSGSDRVGDADQLSVALTNRFLDPRGNEALRVSLAQIFYFRDRVVQLPQRTKQSNSQSDIVLDIAGQQHAQWRARGALLWDTQEKQVRDWSLNFRYQWDTAKILQLQYRYLRDEVDEADVGLLWRLHARWKYVTRWYYSFEDEERLESLHGLEYSDCCWAMRVVQRERLDLDDDAERSRSLWFQLELKGLAGIGRGIDTLFQHGALD